MAPAIRWTVSSKALWEQTLVKREGFTNGTCAGVAKRSDPVPSRW